MKPDLSYIEPDLRPLAVPIGDLSPDPHQAQEHDERSISEIERSLREHGQKKPIVVQADGMVTKAGHGTIEAARRLGWSYLAAVRSSDPDEALRAYAIRDNRSGQHARWIPEKVLEEIAALDVEPDTLGWTLRELGMIKVPSFDGVDGDDQNELDEEPSIIDPKVICPECGHAFKP